MIMLELLCLYHCVFSPYPSDYMFITAGCCKAMLSTLRHISSKTVIRWHCKITYPIVNPLLASTRSMVGLCLILHFKHVTPLLKKGVWATYDCCQGFFRTSKLKKSTCQKVYFSANYLSHPPPPHPWWRACIWYLLNELKEAGIEISKIR